MTSYKDGMNEWKKEIAADKPDWPQLLDKGNLVDRSYIADFIPQFVLIDKAGNIVDFDAPRPVMGDVIEKLLNREINK